ncbi:GDP-mannose 4,6-dehydratase [[Clostridium] fimetarium]|uniref:GDP-4-dehydro-6-deoxy-D-mannose reductase n=1 Tax=[Clostridium] fimetarium TaxID=99656 RepID=A0A1I0RLM7_9FIRM|nr:GDP-mannose 4,6-dehydratase [[Clostridium] fimetarium]SEW42058.1 GDP-4-dehydro-6-deoxy-D-mannose reductase [[Clostridium] fimetarium]
MKALIIGGAGFVGNYLIKHLKNDLKWDVFVTKMAHEKLNNEDVESFDIDILDKDQIKEVFEKVKPDYIFHLAAQSSVALSWKNPSLTIDVNVKGSVNVLDMVRGLDYKPRVLLIGSGEEYGHIKPEESPIVEDNVARPGNIYAATKACQNMIGKIYADGYDLDIMMVRAFNHIGPNQAPMFVVADFCKQVAEIERGEKEPIIYTGNLSAKRDFTDVRDVVRAYGLLIQKGKKGETYNIGSGHAIAIQDILNRILEFSRIKIKNEVDPSKIRPVDVPIIEADTTKIRACTGWIPYISLDTTLLETLEYWRNI